MAEPSKTPAQASYKNPADQAGDSLNRRWWVRYADPLLGGLLGRVSTDSQSLLAAEARIRQARAALSLALSEWVPRVDLSGDVGRALHSQSSDNAFPQARSTTFRAGFQAAYEIDLWGRIRHNVASARAELAASRAGYEALALSLRTEVASAYFALRGIDSERLVLSQTVTDREEALRLTETRRTAGIGTDLDVARSRTELASAKSELTALAKGRGQLENAIAVLTGQNPSSFRLNPDSAQPSIPQIPAGLPSTLVQQRPDVAEATERLAAAGARVRSTQTAWFPKLVLGATAGTEASQADRLADWDSRGGSLNLGLSLPLVDGGRRKAAVDSAKAAQGELLALQRQTILQAFQEVENALNEIRIQARQAEELSEARTAAREASQLSRERYLGGFVSFFEVIEANRTSLAVERAAVQLRAQRLITSVQLIKALGGGWSVPAR